MRLPIGHWEDSPSPTSLSSRLRSAVLSPIWLSILSLVCSALVHAQAPPDVRFRVWVSITDSGFRQKTSTAKFGLHPDATYCVDTLLTGFTDRWFEDDSATVNELPQYPICPPTLEARFFNVKAGCFVFSGEGRPINIHQFHDTTEVDTFRLKWCPTDSADHPLIFRWPSVLGYYCDSMKMTDLAGLSNIDMVHQSAWTYHPDQDPLGITYVTITMWGPKIPPGAPGPVVLTSPVNGATDQPQNLTLMWNSVPGAFYYKVQLDTVRSFSQPILTDSLGTNLRALSGLAQGKWYYWRVLVSNSFGVSYYQDPPDSFKILTLLPVAPPIISPTPGQTGVGITPTFKWHAGTPPISYELQLSKFPGYTPTLHDTTLTDTSVVFPNPLVTCGTYYWRVRGQNNRGFGPFSNASFRVVLAAPGIPVIIQYPDNQTGVPQNARLVWTGRDECTDNYRVQVSLDSLFSQTVFNSSVTETTVVLSNLLGLTDYYWHVRGENPGFQGAYTATRRFTTAVLPPGTPVLISPSSGSTVQTLAPTLVWSKPSNSPARYRLQLDAIGDFANPLIDDSSLTDTTKTLASLVACSRYFWRVSAENAAGSGQFSSASSFSTLLQPPGSPSLISPADGATNQAALTLLSWTPTGPCAPSLYIVNLALDTSFNIIVRRDSLTGSSKLVGPLNANTKYFWRVLAMNDSGSSSSLIRGFTTTTVTKPPVPVLLYPPNGLGGVSITPTLTWDTTARATSWRLQVAYDSIFTQLAFDDSTITQPARQVGPLLNSTSYYWRVSARNDSGTSAYSPFRSFATLFPPAAPSLVRPFDVSVDVSTTPTFVWSQPSGALSYQLQVSRDSLFTNFFSNDSGLTSSSWVVGKELAAYTRYFWRTRAKNSAGWGVFSSRWSFRTMRVGAANWAIPLSVGETGPARDIVYFGISPQATAGIDPSLGEYELPPMTSGFFDVRFVDVGAPYLIGEGLRVDYLPFSGYGQVDTFKVRFQPGTGTYPVRFSWAPSYIRQICDSLVLADEFGGIVVHKRMDVDSTVSVTNTSITSLLLILHGAFPIPLDVKPSVRGIPQGYALSQNYPNPFNPSTRIQFSAEHSSRIRITVFDILGREVATLADAEFFPGIYSVSWSGSGERGGHMPSGIYYARMIAEEVGSGPADRSRFVATIKMLMLK